VTGRAAAFVVVLIACLGLGAVVFLEVTQAGSETASVPAATSPPAARVGDAEGQDAAYSLAPLQKFSEVTARPLFSQGRRPPPAARQATDSPIGSWVLHGIIISKGVSAALVEHGKPVTLSSVGVGQDIEGWTVVSIASDQVVLQSSGRQESLKLYSEESDEQPAPGVPAAGAAQPRRK
jgi:type II secretory pathway component PulC